MRKITITEALRELSLYNEKIEKAIRKPFVALITQKKDVATEKECRKRLKANYASVTDLIKNRDMIKSAVIKSNATTMVKINGNEMTVAEAIDMKHSIEYRQELLEQISGQLASGKTEMERIESNTQAEIDKMFEKIAESDSSDVKDKRKVLEDAYRDSHVAILVDPVNLEKEIDRLTEEIDGFLKNVDVELALSNAVNFIEVDM